jgi:hypothetical protein
MDEPKDVTYGPRNFKECVSLTKTFSNTQVAKIITYYKTYSMGVDGGHLP